MGQKSSQPMKKQEQTKREEEEEEEDLFDCPFSYTLPREDIPPFYGSAPSYCSS